MNAQPPRDEEPPPEVVTLAERRAEARARGDFAEADALRQELADAGWAVIDEAGGGWRLDAIEATAREGRRAIRATDVPSVLDETPSDDVSVHWVDQGWPTDIARAIESFRAHHGDRRVRYVVTDLTGGTEALGSGGNDDVEVVTLEPDTGWGAGVNASIRRATGRIVVLMDGSIEAAGDVLGPLERALSDPGVGIAGPFGVVTHDLREFEAAPGPGPCDAIEGYCMALRRDVLVEVGGVDERFRWYRTADIELSFRVKDRGLRAEVVPLPVVQHEHRMWFETPPADRARWSKRNFYRFLDRWRDRWDLVLEPRPPGSGREER